MPDIAEMLAKAERAYLIAPAGYGKTHQIAMAVSCCGDGRQLILTHTNAGVRSIKEKLNKLGVLPSKYHVETIAGWVLGLVKAYPGISGIPEFDPTNNADWSSIYAGAIKLINNTALKKVIRVSYHGLFVDEYQDCTLSQHALILSLAEILPCRILGDPLQGIFNFDEPLINWKEHIENCFSPLPPLTIPWRWNNSQNPVLGQTLGRLRECLETGQIFNLCNKSITWINWSNEAIRKTCFSSMTNPNGIKSVVAICIHKQECHHMARSLSGRFDCMEELQCDDLFTSSKEIGNNTGFSRINALIEFAIKCRTNVKNDLGIAYDKFKKGILPTTSVSTKNIELVDALMQIADNNDIRLILNALHIFAKIKSGNIFRKELWHEMIRSVIAFESGNFEYLYNAAVSIRLATSESGRKIYDHVVSRTWLIKGLEFDHAIILNADAMSTNNLYVAMTRGSKKLTVLSKSPIISPKNSNG